MTEIEAITAAAEAFDEVLMAFIVAEDENAEGRAADDISAVARDGLGALFVHGPAPAAAAMLALLVEAVGCAAHYAGQPRAVVAGWIVQVAKERRRDELVEQDPA